MSDSQFDPSYWSRQNDALRRVAQAIVGDEALAEDVTQNTWVHALSRNRGTEDEGWLRRVVRSRAIDALRRRRREPAAARIDPDMRPAPQRAAEDVAETLELQRLIVEAVQSLEEPYRSTVVLVHLEGWSVKDVARLHAVPASTVHTRLRRATQRLRERLSGYFDPANRNKPTPAMLAFAKGWPSPSAISSLVPLSTAATLAMNKLLIPVLAAVVLVAVWWVADSSSPTPLKNHPLAAGAGKAVLEAPRSELGGEAHSEMRSVVQGAEASPATAGLAAPKPALVVTVQ